MKKINYELLPLLFCSWGLLTFVFLCIEPTDESMEFFRGSGRYLGILWVVLFVLLILSFTFYKLTKTNTK